MSLTTLKTVEVDHRRGQGPALGLSALDQWRQPALHAVAPAVIRTPFLEVADGARVWIFDVADDPGRRAAERIGPQCTYLHVDVTDEESIA